MLLTSRFVTKSPQDSCILGRAERDIGLSVTLELIFLPAA
jgi:hypothetical protein